MRFCQRSWTDGVSFQLASNDKCGMTALQYEHEQYVVSEYLICITYRKFISKGINQSLFFFLATNCFF